MEERTMRLRALAITVFAAAVASGCGSGSSGGASLGSAPTTRQLDEHANGTTVTVHLGDTVVVVLHSTYWTFDVARTVLQPLGEPQPSPTTCAVPGGGCGTVTARYNASHVGTATLSAHRDSCGEAVRCTGGTGDWTVTVRVT
jgi:hypothetical protein